MYITIFNSVSTSGKIPYSPYGDKTFTFESTRVDSIKDVYFQLCSNFMLNIPVTKTIKTYRRRENLNAIFVEKLDWITVDLDGITKLSDRELCINYFKKQNYGCILAESRNPLNIKGVLLVNNLTPKETKAALKNIQQFVPGVVDLSVCHYASYQAPILKSEILYQNLDGVMLEKVQMKETVQASQELPENVQDICRDIFIQKGYQFHGNQGTVVCSHYSEKKTPRGFTWNPGAPFWMSHWNPDRREDIWQEAVKTKEYKKFYKDLSKQEITQIMPTVKENLCTRFLDKEEEKVRDFLSSFKVLKIQSPMGTAKSNIIDEVIKQSQEKGLRLLLITNRISLADDMASKYPDIKHYQALDLNKYQIGDNLVTQVNSLWRYSLKYFDVVIIDETSSLLFQLLNLEKNTKNIITKVFATNNKKVVLADAFLFDDLVSLFGSSVLEINNGYRDNAELLMYSQVDRWVQEILKCSKEGNITVSSGSTKILKILELLFEQNGITYFTVSSETTKNEKALVYKQFQKTNPKWNVIMYSPTITVGISILADSRDHFHLDRGNSMDTVSSIQMIKRNRNATRIHMVLGERIKYNPTTIERIDTKEFNNIDDDGDITGVSDVGLKFAEVKRLYNTLENRHKVSFLSLLKYQFKTSRIQQITEKITPFVYKVGKLVEKNNTLHALELFEQYKKMSPEELSDIEYEIFSKTKDQEQIKVFNNLMADRKNLSLEKEDIEALVQEDIRTPGAIECYKMIHKMPTLVKSENNFSCSINKYKELLGLGYDLRDYGYLKDNHIYRLNNTLVYLYKKYLT